MGFAHYPNPNWVARLYLTPQNSGVLCTERLNTGCIASTITASLSDSFEIPGGFGTAPIMGVSETRISDLTLSRVCADRLTTLRQQVQLTVQWRRLCANRM